MIRPAYPVMMRQIHAAYGERLAPRAGFGKPVFQISPKSEHDELAPRIMLAGTGAPLGRTPVTPVAPKHEWVGIPTAPARTPFPIVFIPLLSPALKSFGRRREKGISA